MYKLWKTPFWKEGSISQLFLDCLGEEKSHSDKERQIDTDMEIKDKDRRSSAKLQHLHPYRKVALKPFAEIHSCLRTIDKQGLEKVQLNRYSSVVNILE